VLPIWEGTTNVLSLDALRVLQGEKVLEDLFYELKARLENIPAILAEARQNLLAAIDDIRLQLSKLLPGDHNQMEACARNVAMDLSRVVAGGLLIEHAAWCLASEGDMRPVISAQRWCGTELIAPSKALVSRSKSWLRDSHRIAIDDNLSRVQESFA
jgi:hypothetical protein